jgi:hypothetical protein
MHFSGGDKCWNGPDRSLKVGNSTCMPFLFAGSKFQPFLLFMLSCRLGLDVGWAMSLMTLMSLADASMWIDTD